jgi:hypothetical protein
MPTALLIRLQLDVMDRPDDPYHFESFLNVTADDQAQVPAYTVVGPKVRFATNVFVKPALAERHLSPLSVLLYTPFPCIAMYIASVTGSTAMVLIASSGKRPWKRGDNNIDTAPMTDYICRAAPPLF